MTPLAIAFMVASWSFVLGLTAWCFIRVLRSRSTGGQPRNVGGPRDRAGPPGGAE